MPVNRHIFLPFPPSVKEFTTPPDGGGNGPAPPVRNSLQHGNILKNQLRQIWDHVKLNHKNRTAVALPTKDGVYIEFEISAQYEPAIKSLENRRTGIRLLNVRFEEQNGALIATVYIPSRQKNYFLSRITAYLENDLTEKGQRHYQKLVDSIEQIRLAVLESFWQDDPALLPDQKSEWCELWVRTESSNTYQHIESILTGLQIPFATGILIFPERIVLCINADKNRLIELMERCAHMAELRRARETALYWLNLNTKEQSEWARDLLDRLVFDDKSNVSICVLDSGANNGHLLLAPLMDDADCHTCNHAWGVHDTMGHGTGMCGICGFGDLQEALNSPFNISIKHKLESVKLRPHEETSEELDTDRRNVLYGFLTQEGIARAEIQAPRRKRIICMAITSKDGLDNGEPTSWSAAIDSITSGYQDDQRRLMIISAGNQSNRDGWLAYPESNRNKQVEDPAQSWNALTVGAYTQKTTIEDPAFRGWVPIANRDELSPFSSVSEKWDNRKWPIKPDIVCEGGNAIKNSEGVMADVCDDVSVLTTHHKPVTRQFTTLNATSAATAQAAWMAAQIQAIYPHAWPETIRGLLVHSAKWTPAMEQQFLSPNPGKSDYERLLRICGYGVPDLSRATECANNSLTLIAQQVLQPFDKKEHGAGYRTKEMHLYELPWPKQQLLDYPDIDVTLKITLSYFIEPGPGKIGWKYRYRYPSHGLRFKLIPRSANLNSFIKKINKAAREDNDKISLDMESDRWKIGSDTRDMGSIHSDIWTGSAAEMANCNYIAVVPVIGWWRERHWENRWNRETRYSLIVSLFTPEQKIDIYTPVKLTIPI